MRPLFAVLLLSVACGGDRKIYESPIVDADTRELVIPKDFTTVNCECARRIAEYMTAAQRPPVEPVFAACPELVQR